MHHTFAGQSVLSLDPPTIACEQLIDQVCIESLQVDGIGSRTTAASQAYERRLWVFADDETVRGAVRKGTEPRPDLRGEELEECVCGELRQPLSPADVGEPALCLHPEADAQAPRHVHCLRARLAASGCCRVGGDGSSLRRC